MKDDLKTNENNHEHYKGLPRLLYGVRWTQHLLSIIAEVLILLAFAMSGMDVSLGGVMASIPLLKILWAGMFALGIDTAFALSWVRVRQCVLKRQWVAFGWNLILALGMSFVIFEPLAIQLFQQSLSVGFDQALTQLGINLTILVYARSGVAVFLGAILAITNVESADMPTSKQVEATSPRLHFKLIKMVFSRLRTKVPAQSAEHAQVVVKEEDAQLLAPPEIQVPLEDTTAQEVDVTDVSTQEPVSTENVIDLQARRQQKLEVPVVSLDGLSTYDKVVKVLETLPTDVSISDRELGKISGCAAATAKKHRDKFKREQAAKPTESEE